jgi:hypothetical protein
MTKDEVMIKQKKCLPGMVPGRSYRIRYTMNGFVIAIGSYVEALTKKANEVATTIGKVHVDVGGTACKVPMATEYIKKIEDKGNIGKKRKAARC